MPDAIPVTDQLLLRGPYLLLKYDDGRYFLQLFETDDGEEVEKMRCKLKQGQQQNRWRPIHVVPVYVIEAAHLMQPNKVLT